MTCDSLKYHFTQTNVRFIHLFRVHLLLCASLLLYLSTRSQIAITFVGINSKPLIVLFTHNKSVKTRDHICKGGRNDGHVVNFDNCPKQCQFSCRMEDFSESASAILFFGEDFYWSFGITDRNRTSSKQRWIFWSWETPIQHPEYFLSGLTFNWTMTYRRDSDIIHSYGRFIRRNASSTVRDKQSVDFYLSPRSNLSRFNSHQEYLRRKNRILWFVSNCNPRTRRNEIAKLINLSYPIDEYGLCSGRKTEKTLEELALTYKFYLSFENSHCKDYITEKSFYNALNFGAIPLVLGPTQHNAEEILPPKSFVFYNDIKTFIEELNTISNNFTRFEQLHLWRQEYRVLTWKSLYQLDDQFCKLCIKLHEDSTEKVYQNFSGWLDRCPKP